jgi:hypothetical protein
MIQLPINVTPKITLSSYLHYRVILLRNLHIINPHCLHKYNNMVVQTFETVHENFASKIY